MSGFQRVVFVCQNERAPDHPKGSCAAEGSVELLLRFKNALKERGLKDAMRACGSTCLDHCRHAATVVVYPDDVWYAHVKPEDVDEIVEKHLVGGEPVERLRIAKDEPR